MLTHQQSTLSAVGKKMNYFKTFDTSVDDATVKTVWNKR